MQCFGVYYHGNRIYNDINVAPTNDGFTVIWVRFHSKGSLHHGVSTVMTTYADDLLFVPDVGSQSSRQTVVRAAKQGQADDGRGGGEVSAVALQGVLITSVYVSSSLHSSMPAWPSSFRSPHSLPALHPSSLLLPPLIPWFTSSPTHVSLHSLEVRIPFMLLTEL